MAKTKEITFSGSAGRFDPSTNRLLKVTIEDPNIEEMLSEIHTDDIAEFVKHNIGVEEIYDTDELEKWVESNGYVKSND